VKFGLALALVALLLKGMPGPASLEMAHWMLIWGVGVVAPLALQLSAPPQPPKTLKFFLSSAGVLMAAGWLWQGNWLVAGAFTWLLATLGFALWGSYRLWTRRPFCLAQTTCDVGFLYAPVGGVWTFAYAWQRGLMGFDATMTLLTGVHFCFVTLGAMQWSGLAGQVLGQAPHLDLAWMIPYHGLLNAMGFVTLGLWGFRSMRSQQIDQPVDR